MIKLLEVENLNEQEEVIITCHNGSGGIITNRSVCYISGDFGGVPQITKAQADSASHAKGMLVTTIVDIAHGAKGICQVIGKVEGFTGLTTGAIQYLSDDTAGSIEETATTDSGEIVRIMGYALSTTILYFNPDKTYIEVT